jgi:hypothetical protein
METFERKLENLSIVFTSTLQDFNEVMTSPLLTILAGQIHFAEEFKKASSNIKVAC